MSKHKSYTASCNLDLPSYLDPEASGLFRVIPISRYRFASTQED
jgi:hypothetical protein